MALEGERSCRPHQCGRGSVQRAASLPRVGFVRCPLVKPQHPVLDERWIESAQKFRHSQRTGLRSEFSQEPHSRTPMFFSFDRPFNIETQDAGTQVVGDLASLALSGDDERFCGERSSHGAGHGIGVDVDDVYLPGTTGDCLLQRHSPPIDDHCSSDCHSLGKFI